MSPGKNQKSGIYNMGVPYVRQSNNKFKPGVQVYNVKTGIVGVIINKIKFKSMRSLSLVKYSSNKTQYIQNKLIRTLDYKKTQQLEHFKKYSKNKHKFLGKYKKEGDTIESEYEILESVESEYEIVESEESYKCNKLNTNVKKELSDGEKIKKYLNGSNIDYKFRRIIWGLNP
tara:strand:+ start:3982 stop:4500 length:519 start_codon:yes stop_codon:yes gene_type:complete